MCHNEHAHTHLDAANGGGDAAIEDAEPGVAPADGEEVWALRWGADRVELHHSVAAVRAHVHQHRRAAARLPPVQLAHCAAQRA